MTRHAEQKRDRKITFACDDEEHAMLDEVAAADGRSAADWIRRAIRAAHAEHVAAKKGAKPARKPRR